MTFHYAYLFRAEAYRADIQPLTVSIAAGDLGQLRERAWPALARPDTAAFLSSLRYDAGDILRGDADWEEETLTSILLSALLVDYLVPVPLGSDFRYVWRSYHHAMALLEVTGWDRNDVLRLFGGNSMCELLRLPADHFRRGNMGSPNPLGWCDLMPGWLEPEAIRAYRDRLAGIDPSIEMAIKAIQGGHYRRWTAQGIRDAMRQSYDHLIGILDTALARNSHLLVTFES